MRPETKALYPDNMRYHRADLLIKMGQLELPGFELEKPTVPARVLEGKALATRARGERYAR